MLVFATERCQSGRTGATRNRLTWETRSVGSNPTLSSSLASYKIPVGRYAVKRKNDLPAVSVWVSLLLLFSLRTKPHRNRFLTSITSGVFACL